MTMVEAMDRGLSLMHDVLGGRRKPDEKLVRAYLFVIQDDGLAPEDIEAACKWFCRDSEGTFPPGPIFRKRCQVEQSRREIRRQNAIYESKQLAMQDQFSDEAENDPILSKEETRKFLAERMAQMESKFGTWPGGKVKSRREMDREVAALRGGA